jgi:two-component sensor histidine kinase
MQTIFPPIKSKPKFELDFTLAYVGIIFLGFSIAGTELNKLYPDNKIEVVQMRLIHTIYLMASVFVAQIFFRGIRLKKVGYVGLGLVGLGLALPSLLVRVFLTENFGLISGSEVAQFFGTQFIISLIQAFFWIPLVIILGGQRSRITQVFKEYEKRLVTITRKTVRVSSEFVGIKRDIDQNFENELNIHTHNLLTSISNSDNRELGLSERNSAIQEHLMNNSLREYSRRLNQQSGLVVSRSKITQDMHSLGLISKQFNILYNYVARKSPLPALTYTLLSFALILPNYINFYSFSQVLVIAPPGFLVIHLIASKINQTLLQGGRFAILKSNFLTLLIGYLPFIEMTLSQSFNNDPETQFPLSIVAIFYPIGFYVYVRLFQILQPEAIEAIANDEVYASASLKGTVLGIVRNEFEQSTSHQWATFIHGKILTRLAATSLKLEQAVSNNDVESFEFSLQNLSQVLEDPTKDFHIVNLKLKEEVGSRLNPWEGLISIKVKIDPDLENIANDRVRDLGEVIEEIISNSVRHGSSQNIAISITRSTHPDVHIDIEDDALKPLPLGQSRIGLGTKILNLVTDGRWSISHVEGKTTVNLTMSLLDDRNV